MSEIKLLAHSVRILARYFDHVQNRCPAFFFLSIISRLSCLFLPTIYQIFSVPVSVAWLCLQLSNIWCFNLLDLPSFFHDYENKMLYELAYLLVLEFMLVVWWHVFDWTSNIWAKALEKLSWLCSFDKSWSDLSSRYQNITEWSEISLI